MLAGHDRCGWLGGIRGDDVIGFNMVELAQERMDRLIWVAVIRTELMSRNPTIFPSTHALCKLPPLNNQLPLPVRILSRPNIQTNFRPMDHRCPGM